MFNWIKKSLMKKSENHQKIVKEEDIELVKKYLKDKEEIINVVKPYQGKSPLTILEEAGYVFESLYNNEDELKKYDEIITVYDYSSTKTKRFICMCAILHILGENVDDYVSSSDENKVKYYHKYWEYIVNCFIPMDELLSFIQNYMKERNLYVTNDILTSHFDDTFYGWVMMRVYSSPLHKYVVYGGCYD